MKINLLIPMSGQGTRYQRAGYSQPKPLIPVSNIPMIERLLQNFPQHWAAHFVMAKNHESTELPALLKTLRPHGHQYFIAPHTLGPGHALESALKVIPEDEAVLVSYCDYGMVWDSAQFEKFVQESHCDACVVSYRGFHAHYLNPQTYAYSRMDGERVVEVREKGSFTKNREHEYASCGAYYFKSARLLKQALREQQTLGLQLNGESYTSLTVQALLQSDPKAHVRVFEIDGFFQWGTPEDLRNFEYWEKSFAQFNKFSGEPRMECAQLIMPMAGKGSRFEKLSKIAKPLIPLAQGGIPMFQEALRTLPKAANTVLVTLENMANQVSTLSEVGTKIISLELTPSGQALSTEAGMDALNSKGDIVVSSCDHGIVLDPKRWSAFRERPECDAAIFTIQGFPGATRNPQAFAYVVAENDGEGFPPVTKVSVKKPISSDPSKDPLLVGTFWFASPDVLRRGLAELKHRNLRVNGELYLDSIFECLITLGLRVRHVPLDGYLCWGDPDSMAEALYWQDIFCGRRLSLRSRIPSLGENHVGV